MDAHSKFNDYVKYVLRGLCIFPFLGLCWPTGIVREMRRSFVDGRAVWDWDNAVTVDPDHMLENDFTRIEMWCSVAPCECPAGNPILKCIRSIDMPCECHKLFGTITFLKLLEDFGLSQHRCPVTGVAIEKNHRFSADVEVLVKVILEHAAKLFPKRCGLT